MALRLAVTALLVTILASCPILCGTAEAMLGVHHCGAAPHSDTDPTIPSPVNDDNCLCNGALKSGDAKLLNDKFVADGSPSSIDTPLGLPGQLLAILAFAPESGAGIGLPGHGWLESPCALVQRLRC